MGNQPTEPSRELVWDRVKKAAQNHHNHHKERGTSKLIGIDADQSPQYVSDWKSGRAPIPMATLAKLANLYGVSVGYLAGYTDDPTPRTPTDEASLRAKMVELVESVVTDLNPNASPTLVVELCDLALSLLQDKQPDEMVIGSLYKRMKQRELEQAGRASADSPDH